MRDPLRVSEGRERIERDAIRLDPVRKWILPEEFLRALEVIETPRNRKARGSRLGSAGQTAFLRRFEGLKEIAGDPRVSFEDRPFDRQHMHDRKHARRLEVRLFDALIVFEKAHDARI